MNALGDAALTYAARGWRVFPCWSAAPGRCGCPRGTACGSPGKHPLTLNGVLAATTDPAAVTAAWRRWPDANIGGSADVRSGFWVVDIDPDHGGEDSWRQLEGEHGPAPETIESLTGGGGRHLLYQHPGDQVRNVVGVLPGIDIRADGGYVILPPSRHASGRTYQWDGAHHPDDTPLARAPEWLLQLGQGSSNGWRPPECVKEIPIGIRNMTLTSLAGTMHRRGICEDAIVAALQVVNQQQCDNPLDARDVERIVRSVTHYPAGTLPWRVVQCPTDLHTGLVQPHTGASGSAPETQISAAGAASPFHPSSEGVQRQISTTGPYPSRSASGAYVVLPE